MIDIENVKINIDGIESDVRKYLTTFARYYTKEAARQITKKAKSCIEMFYKDYTPVYYDRTDDLKNNSYVQYYRSNGRAFYGGVRITSDFMSPYYSGGIMNQESTDPYIVAQLGWHGWHGDPTGYNGKFSPIHTTPPLDVLNRFARNKKFLAFIYNYAEKIALRANYSYIKFK